ncbi:mitochondrial protein from FMP27-domain-containing protein [Biscogniauxia marginata]|nr:mitochondrial protein from FMP27-domain-containing protein [Biscogniauxia marginata]
MSPRKRPRPNPSSDSSLPAALLSQTTRIASQLNNASSSSLPSSSTRRQGMPPIKRDDSNTSTATNPNGSKQVRKSRSWYGSWPHKSSPSTQVARETIMGDTLRTGATPDFSRYEIRKGDASAESDARSIKTLPRISEVEVQPRQDDSNPPKHQQERLREHDNADHATKKQAEDDKDDTSMSNGHSPASPQAAQRPPASSGWFSWLGRAPGPENLTTLDETMENDPPKQPETTPPHAPQGSSSHTETSPDTPKIAKPTSSWFGYWYTPAPPVSPEVTVSTTANISKDGQTASKEIQDVTMEDAPAPATNQPSAGSTWAFWSRYTGQRGGGKSTTAPEQGELAVIGDGSEASPRRSTGVEVNDEALPVKEPPIKTAKEHTARSSFSKKKKRSHPHTLDLDEPLPARPGTPQSDISSKTVSTKPATPGLSSTHPQNLLLPSFRSTYHMKENPSIIKQIAQLLLRIQQPSANHVFLAKEPLKIKKAIAIGVHGLFPASFLRPMIGQPTGTSIRFANHCAEAIRRWADRHGCAECEIEKVALEGEGKIADRVDNLWKLLLNWIEHIRRADLIVVACHSQGVPVGLMLLAKLIDLGIITTARIGVCAMAGVSLGPFPDYKSGMGMLMGSAAELWQFADPESEISKRYEHALEVVVNHGGRITYVGSIDDQLVPMESAVYSPASHPYIYRAVFVDGRIHAPDFIAHLVGFALKLRNLGISDHGLIRELSVPLAGSLYSGEGHSRLYDDEQVYDLAISHALETSSVSGVPCRIGKHEGLTNPNPYVLPWIMRGLLEEEFVRTELYSETAELLKQFDDWTPSTKALKDVKYRLEATDGTRPALGARAASDMALLNPTFVLGIIVLLYLSSFVLFAVLRILTGISIQRVGYFSLRRLAYTPKDGIKIEIRGLGLNLHRPTFSQPTWLSIVVSELAITMDIKELEGQKRNVTESNGNGDTGGQEGRDTRLKSIPEIPLSRKATFEAAQSASWQQLTKMKENLKKLHRNVRWLRMVDVVATDSTVNITDIGKVQIGSFTLALDTRHRMVDRARYFFQSKADKGQRQPAEWSMTLRSVLFTAKGGESIEILDSATLNVHGFLYENLDGLRDAAIALKLGRVHIPYDDVLACVERYQRSKRLHASTFTQAESIEISVDKVIQEIDKPGSTNQDLMQAVSESKEFVSSILRGIKEVQFAVSFVSLTKKVQAIRSSGSNILLNASMKEVGIDLHRLDPKSPAHRMYFPSKDIAHEALAAALSISVGLDDGHGKPERVVYIPMATTTVKTTLPSKTMELSDVGSAEERNANILFANSVVTSPSVDLDPKHLPVLLALLRPRPRPPKAHTQQRHMLISRLLPKANIKFSMHEPVVRIALPPVEKTDDPDDFDLIISSISSISLDLESFHSAVEDLHYSLASSLRVQTHHLYYQTAQGNRFDLIDTESFDLKIQLSATPDVHVVANGHLQTFAIRMTRPEITKGMRQIVRQLRPKVEPDKRAAPKTPKSKNVLRALPQWLLHFSVQVEDFSAEITGVDDDFPGHTRGIVLQVDSWSTEYRAQRLDVLRPRPSSRRRGTSRSFIPDAEFLNSISSPLSPRKKPQNYGDGRRIAVHIRGLEAFVVEAPEKWEVEPFVHMPRFEVALSTHSDAHGPILHIHSHVRTLLVQYSLFRHYSLGVAIMVVRRAFVRGGSEPQQPTPTSPEVDHLSPPIMSPGSPATGQMDFLAHTPKEQVTVDFKAALIQVKAEMPADPPLMLQIYSVEAGRHRWSPPFFYAKLIRLYAGAPRMQGVWTRIASIKTIRVDYRTSRRKMSTGAVQNDKMFDVVTDAMRIAVPHELILSQITDNVTNVIKASEQLHHRFKTGTNEYILDKGPEGPKNVPKVSLRTRTLLFELEDGAFEWKLGMIYRAGRVEQLQRLAREEAYRVKVKKIHEEEIRRETSRLRNRSAMTRGRGVNTNAWGRSRSEDRLTQEGRDERSHSEDPRGRNPRYDPESVRGMSGNAHVSIQEARTKLHEHNAQSWKKRIDRHYLMARNGMKELRGLFWGPDQLPDDFVDTERILEVPQRPALMGTIITDLHIVIDKPSFPLQKLPDFLHKVGKGIPKDMEYALLVPMSVQISMSEARVSLRDYPLPFLHVPAIKPGQPSKLPALSLKTDFVIAEEFRGIESTRKVRVQITPPSVMEPGMPNGSFAIDVRRTVGAVKSYSDMQVDMNTAYPTRITWCPSYQPAIQDMMIIIESFTKPQLDPSERVGFWDKVRLNFHSRIRVAWKGGGDVQLALKGTRDPYQVTGNGAGFLMCWRNNVRLNIHTEDDPTRLVTVDSGEYVLAIPDYSHQARDAAGGVGENESMASESSYKSGAAFKKVVMKLSGNVQWMAGLVFEQAIEGDKRNFEFRPHYDIVLKAPQYAKSQDGTLPYDAFRGFRSEHIHLSIAVRAPADRDWSSSEPHLSKSYNTVHLTPRFFTHFFAWWSLFSGPMSLPVRQGPLWPSREQNSKKFGRHLGTIKFNILFAPLFLSHIYKHKDAEDYAENSVSATGIKVRFDSFMLDIHMRREEFNTQDRGHKTNGRTTGIKIHAAQLDLLSADVRAVSASIKGTATEAITKNSVSTLITQQEDDGTGLSNFTIPDNDFNWIDMDDFMELDWILPSESTPDTKILPLVYAPRVTYFRQTDIGGTIDGDPDRTSPFGDEPTHLCIMSQDDDPRRVQSQLIQSRLDQLETQIATNIRNVGDAELRMIRSDGNDPDIKAEYESLSRHTNVLHDKRIFLESMLQHMSFKTTESDQTQTDDDSEEWIDLGEGKIKAPSGAEFASDFKNRFVVHNMQLKWNNLLRNIILRYSHQVSQRRGFVYYLSRPAVKFILDIVEEQARAKQNNKPTNTSPAAPDSSTPSADDKSRDTNADIEYRIKQILKDGRKYVNDDGPSLSEGAINTHMEDITSGIAEEFAPQSSYHVRLIAPQIQLQSEKNKKHVVLITAKGMELKVVEVMEKARLSDQVSGLVQRRFLLRMDSAQFFVTHQKWFAGQLLSMYSGNTYGTPSGSSWPPWVPMEVMYDFQSDPFGFKRVVQKTSALLRYDKFNTLRLKYNDEVNDTETASLSANITETRTDNLWVEFPQARALCNSSQYYAVYVIVLDLLMYSEPLEKTRSERLEKIMLASDFSDLRGIPEMVTRLQERIRQLEEIKSHFQIHSKYLDRQGWEDRLLLERDLAACEDELFFMMKAITTSQRKYESGSQSSAMLKWTIAAKEIVWHLIRDNNEPLVEMQLRDVEYDRTDYSDGSHINLMQVGKVLGLNLMRDAIYPEMVAPYFEDEKGHATDLDGKHMIRVYWHMLEAIAGIPVMDHFEVNLFPMKVQLEHEVGTKLFEYIFPGMEEDKSTEPGNQNDSPFVMKSSFPGEAEDDTPDDATSGSGRLGSSASDKAPSFTTRAGSLELRLRPTLNLDSRSPEESPQRSQTINVNSGEGNSVFRFFGSKTATKKPSYESLRPTTPRPGVGRAATAVSATSENKKGTRFAMSRKPGNSGDKPSDDLTKMITRASNYVTFAYIKLPSVVLCLSYKGKGDRNLEDVHDFVFRLPTIEYRNKTWSNLDLALAMKSRIIKALISHTGAIIGNKFKLRPNMAQQNRLREMANSSVLLATPSLSNSGDNSDDSSSIFGASQVDYSRSPPRSIQSSGASILAPQRPSSRGSSIMSSRSFGRPLANGDESSQRSVPPVPGFLTMAPTDRPQTGLGADMNRPKSSSSNSVSALSFLRPATSAGPVDDHSDRRKPSGGGFFKGKLSAFGGKRKDRANSDARSVHGDEDEHYSRDRSPSRSVC